MAINTVAGWGTVITQADAWRIHSSFSGSTNMTSNWERVDSDSFLKIGDGMSESGGIFTFPKTGIWLITVRGSWQLANGGSSRYIGIEMEQTTDNQSSWSNAARFYTNINGSSSTWYTSGTCQHMYDVQNTSNYKVKFKTEVHDSNTNFDTSSNHSQNLFTFIRLGDT